MAFTLFRRFFAWRWVQPPLTSPKVTYQPEGTVRGTTAATVRESCSLGTKVLGAICPFRNRFARRAIIRVSMLERALVCLTLSADTSYDGKLPSAGVAQWQSEGLIIPRPWVRFPPPAPDTSRGAEERTVNAVKDDERTSVCQPRTLETRSSLNKHASCIHQILFIAKYLEQFVGEWRDFALHIGGQVAINFPPGVSR